MKASLEQAIVEALKALPGPANLRELARALEIPMAPVAAELQRLRYQGKVAWDRLELSPSMISADGVASAVKAEGGEETSTRPLSADGPDDEEDDGVNDIAKAGWSRPVARQAHNLKVAGSNPAPATSDESAGFVPKDLLHRAGVRAAQTRAAARPLPAPEHEPEIARMVREEVEDMNSRRRSARSTATVSQPLELRKYRVPDMTFSEAVGSMLSDDPKAIMRAVSRKHPAMWRRCIFLGRATGQSPMQALYAALDAGLDQLEHPKVEIRNVA